MILLAFMTNPYLSQNSWQYTYFSLIELKNFPYSNDFIFNIRLILNLRIAYSSLEVAVPIMVTDHPKAPIMWQFLTIKF